MIKNRMNKIYIKNIFILLSIFTPIFFIPYEIYTDEISSTVTTASTNRFIPSNTLIRPIPISFFFIIICCFFYLKTDLKIKNIKYFILIIFCFLINILFYDFEIKKVLYFILFSVPFFSFIISLKININFKIQEKFIIFFCLIISLISLYNLIINTNFQLKDKLFFFTIYQNQQYFGPLLAALCFYPLLVQTVTKLNTIKIFFFIIYFLLTIANLLFYNSLSVILIIIVGIILLLIKYHSSSKNFFYLIIIVSSLIITLKKNEFTSKIISEISVAKKIEIILQGEIPDNILHRKEIYIKFYQNLNYQNLLIGNKNLNFINSYQSTHNYITELIYFYGLLPAIIVIIFFFKLIKKVFKNKDNQYFYFAILFIFYLILENLTKVPMRQLYSGIISFYIIATLLRKFKN